MVTMLGYHHRRRIFHLIPGLLIIAISYVIPTYPLGFILLGLVTSAVHYMHIKRSNDRQFDIWYIQKYGQLLRGEELGEWILVEGEYRRKKYPIHSGAFYWLLGTTLSSIIFSLDVARTALLVLSVSDPFAAYVGVWFSNRNCNIVGWITECFYTKWKSRAHRSYCCWFFGLRIGHLSVHVCVFSKNPINAFKIINKCCYTGY